MACLAPDTAPVAATVTDEFARRLARWEERSAAAWRAMPAAPPVVGEPVPRRRQRDNERASAELIDHLARRVAAYPQAPAERAAWRGELQETVRRFGEERLGWPDGYRRLLLGEEFFAASTDFARQARAAAPDLRLDDLGQALRNVWIGNSLQMLLDLPVAATPALFAYSMLYPLTDNYLDDPAVPPAAKRAFNRRLGRRLAGLAEEPATAREEAVFGLVRRIEEAWPRAAWTEVFWSLLAIHGGQLRSLRQQAAGPTDAELVATSCAKGGASVLADGYLVAGRLDPAVAEFCFGYGVVLQLLDDLQDVVADRRAGHATLFSRRSGSLDAPAGRLYHLLGHLLDGGGPFGGAAWADRRDLIRRNCAALFVGAVAENPGLFSRRFRAALEAGWPLRFGAMRRLRRRARRAQESVGRRLRRERGVDSLLDLLVAA
jgi:hypothetical protein